MDVLSASLKDDKIAWYENDGSQSFTARTITTSADGATAVYPIDLDQDGDIDVVSGNLSDIDDDNKGEVNQIKWYENNGYQSFAVHSIGSSTNSLNQGYEQDLAIVDLDRDGDLDIVAGFGSDKKIVWLKNDGNQQFTQNDLFIETRNIGVMDISSIEAKDITKDGHMDIVFTTFSLTSALVLTIASSKFNGNSYIF